jgi:hypothetical protein
MHWLTHDELVDARCTIKISVQDSLAQVDNPRIQIIFGENGAHKVRMHGVEDFSEWSV